MKSSYKGGPRRKKEFSTKGRTIPDCENPSTIEGRLRGKKNTTGRTKGGGGRTRGARGIDCPLCHSEQGAAVGSEDTKPRKKKEVPAKDGRQEGGNGAIVHLGGKSEKEP